MDRFGTVERDAQAGEVERGAVFGRGATDAEFVGEVRRARGGDAILRDQLQPAQRFLQERGGWHEQAGGADVERLHHDADEAHVVKEREPAGDHVVGVVPVDAADHLLVGEEIAVGEHHALRRAGGAGGVLQEGEGFIADRGRGPVFSQRVGHILGGDERERSVSEVDWRELCGSREECARGEGDAGAGVTDDGFEAVDGFVGPRRIGRHDDDAGVETAEEGCDEIEARRVNEQRAVAGRTVRLQRHRDGAGAAVEVAVGEGGGDFLAGGLKRKSSFITGVARVQAQQVNPRGRGLAGGCAVRVLQQTGMKILG